MPKVKVEVRLKREAAFHQEIVMDRSDYEALRARLEANDNSVGEDIFEFLSPDDFDWAYPSIDAMDVDFDIAKPAKAKRR